jgi:hypothetical protein
MRLDLNPRTPAPPVLFERDAMIRGFSTVRDEAERG